MVEVEVVVMEMVLGVHVKVLMVLVEQLELFGVRIELFHLPTPVMYKINKEAGV
jgi:hypothetical protein